MRAQRSIANYLSAVAYGGATIGLALVTMPLRLAWLGEEVMGLLRILLDAFGYLVLLEFGIAAALSSLFATALARDDTPRILVLFRLGVRELLKATVLKVAAGVALTVGLMRFLDVSPDLTQDFLVACGVGLLSLVLTPIGAFRSLLEGAQRGYSIQLALTVQATLTSLLSLWFAYVRWGVTGQVVAVSLGVLASQSVLILVSRRRFPNILATGPLAADPTAQASLRRLNRPAFMSQMAGTIGLLSDNLLVGLFLSPQVVMRFFLTQRLASIAQAQLQGIGTASWAGMAEIHARGDLELFNKRALEMTRLVAIASAALLIPLAVFNRAFIGLWVGSDLYGGGLVSTSAVLVAAGQSIVSLWGWLFHASGQLSKVAPVVAATAAVNVVASVVCTLMFGLAGPLLGTLASYALVSTWCFPSLLRATFGISIGRLASAVVWPAVVGLPVSAGAMWLESQPLSETWLGVAFGAGATGMAYLLVSWFWLLGPGERMEWRGRIRGARARLGR